MDSLTYGSNINLSGISTQREMVGFKIEAENDPEKLTRSVPRQRELQAK